MDYTGFTGTFKCNLDDKKRIQVPARLREQFRAIAGQDVAFTLSRWFEPCIAIFSPETWAKKFVPLFQNADSIFDVDEQEELKRFLFSSVTNISADKTGRILLPDYLMEHAGINKEIVLLGIYDRIEIWSKEAWEEKQNTSFKDMRNIAKRFAKKRENLSNPGGES